MGVTTIEWTDCVWNVVTGCTKVSSGCRSCYAETIARRFWGERKFAEVRCHPERLNIPLHWKKPRRIFVNSMSDLFHEDVPDDFILNCLKIMKHANQHIYQVLTKRPGRMLHFMQRVGQEDGQLFLDHLMGGMMPHLDHVWLGVSIEDQATADERIPLLLQTPAAVRWVSAEPLLGPADVRMYLSRTNMPGFNLLPGFRDPLPGLDWIICGAESGPHARPMDLDWARSLRDQCKVAGVKFFMKQLCDKGRKIPLHHWPTYLLIREWPDRTERERRT